MPDEHPDLLAHLPHQQGLTCLCLVSVELPDSEQHSLASKPEVRWYYIEKERLAMSLGKTKGHIWIPKGSHFQSIYPCQ